MPSQNSILARECS